MMGHARLASPDRESGGERGDKSPAAGGNRGSNASQHLRRRRIALDFAV